MRAEELWVESYQGEVLGEVFFAGLAARERDPERRHQLETVADLERATRALAEPLFERRGWSRGDTAATTADAEAAVTAFADVAWEDLLAGVLPITDEFLAKYRELVTLAGDEDERAIAKVYVDHEEALASFARRCLGQEPGDPLARILALPHVAVAPSP